MTVGDPSGFAIQSDIITAFERRLLLAHGCFGVHIGGQRYGDGDPEAAMLLADAFGEIGFRLSRRGCHTAPFASEPDAGRIAAAYQDAYRDPVWAPEREKERFFGLSQEEFRDLIESNRCVWGHFDEFVFNDMSEVLHFDVGGRVRLIAFKCTEPDWHHDPASLADVWLEAAAFYRILEAWRDAFEAEWSAAPKIKQSEDGVEPYVKAKHPFAWDRISWD